MEREGQLSPHIRVETLEIGVCLLQRKPGFQTLQPDVILLVDHHSDGPVGEEGGGRTHFTVVAEFRQFPGDQVTLMQQLAFISLQVVDSDERCVVQLSRCPTRPLHLVEYHLVVL